MQCCADLQMDSSCSIKIYVHWLPTPHFSTNSPWPPRVHSLILWIWHFYVSRVCVNSNLIFQKWHSSLISCQIFKLLFLFSSCGQGLAEAAGRVLCRRLWMCGQAAPGRGPGRAFLFVKEPPKPIMFLGWGAWGAGEYGVLTQRGALSERKLRPVPE